RTRATGACCRRSRESCLASRCARRAARWRRPAPTGWRTSRRGRPRPASRSPYAAAARRGALLQLDDGAFERDADHDRSGAAHVLAAAGGVLAAVDAADVDHRVAALPACALLQVREGADEGDIAGFLARLADQVALGVGRERDHALRDARRFLVTEEQPD